MTSVSLDVLKMDATAINQIASFLRRQAIVRLFISWMSIPDILAESNAQRSLRNTRNAQCIFAKRRFNNENVMHDI